MTTLRSMFRALISGKTLVPAPTLSEVEARASARSYSVDAIVANPTGVDLYDDTFRAFCRDHAAELLPRLKNKVSARPTLEQIAIARLLMESGDEIASDILLDVLETGDEAAQRQAVIAIWGRNIGRTAPMRIDEPRALRLLRPLLQLEETDWRKITADALFGLRLPEVRDIKLAMLNDPALPMRMTAASSLAREGDPAAWPVLREVLLGSSDEFVHERDWAIFSLKDLASANTDPLREEIASLAARQIEAQFNRDDNDAANDLKNLLAVIEAAAPSWEATFLETVFTSRLMAWPRGIALRHLAKLQGLAVLPRLTIALDDPELAPEALGALAEAGAQAATTEVTDRIGRLIADTADTRLATAAAEALAVLGHSNDLVLLNHADKLEPWQRFAVSIRAKKVSADAFLAMLQDAEVLASARLEASGPGALDAFRAAWQNRKEGVGLCELLVQTKALHYFDTETDGVPPNYVELLTDLAEIARLRFRIEKISMQAAHERGANATQHEVLLLFDGRPVRLLLKEMGDWFDVGGLLGQLNTEIAAKGKPHRFVTLHTGEQLARVLLGHAAKLLALRRDYSFPLADDPDAPMRTGQDFEWRVTEQLEGKGNL